MTATVVTTIKPALLPSPNLHHDEGDPKPQTLHVNRKHQRGGTPRTQMFCLVCGDSGAGNFYGVTVCHPCKTFFIRYCTLGRYLRCQGVNQCTINPTTRALCQRCRLHRCISVGMVRQGEASLYTQLSRGSLPLKFGLVHVVAYDVH